MSLKQIEAGDKVLLGLRLEETLDNETQIPLKSFKITIGKVKDVTNENDRTRIDLTDTKDFTVNFRDPSQHLLNALDCAEIFMKLGRKIKKF